MNGIDIASYQDGIDLNKVDCDFVIIKATQGESYINPSFKSMLDNAKESGKLIGVYHYINGIGYKKEMEHFYKTIKKYIGNVIICLDWEEIQNSAWRDEKYLENCIKYLKKLTDVSPFVYASKSVFPFALCSKYECGTWVAQYANNNSTGFQQRPWNESAYTCDIRQYSSTGIIKGYKKALDLNKAYFGKTVWNAWCKPKSSPKKTSKQVNIDNLVKKTLKGEYGNGVARMKKLGSDYAKVQKRINRLMKLAKKTKAGKYGNGDERKSKLGADYSMVQWIINNKLV